MTTKQRFLFTVRAEEEMFSIIYQVLILKAESHPKANQELGSGVSKSNTQKTWMLFFWSEKFGLFVFVAKTSPVSW